MAWPLLQFKSIKKGAQRRISELREDSNTEPYHEMSLYKNPDFYRAAIYVIYQQDPTSMLATRCQIHGSSGPLSMQQGRCVATGRGVMAGKGSDGAVDIASTIPLSLFPTQVTQKRLPIEQFSVHPSEFRGKKFLLMRCQRKIARAGENGEK